MKSEQPTILFLCTAQYLNRERKGLVEALRKVTRVRCLNQYTRDINDVVNSGPSPDLLLHPDMDHPYLPEGLDAFKCATACLHIDTYSAPAHRARVSHLFDLVLVCHPGYPEYFIERGNPECLLFPHAIRAPQYRDPLPEKTIDVAMVGRLSGSDYSYRRRCVRAVTENLDVTTNDFQSAYDYPAMADVYRKAKIGLNVSRNGYLEDANLRCFEVMGGGALLLTPHPTELSKLGLEDGAHFVTFHSQDDLVDKIRYFLNHNEAREEIALNGREATLTHFTYDRWSERLIERIDEGIPQQAPARSMSEGEVASIHVDYYSKRGEIDETLHHLRRQRKADGPSLRSVAKAAKVTVRGWQNAFFS